jgi:hypothetical protein
MNNHYFIGKSLSRLSLFLFSAALALSCRTPRETGLLDRNFRPQVIAGVPGGASEIREVLFHKVPGESGHEVLHLRGQLFTKTATGGGSVQISPCNACVISITTPEDSTISANLTTAADGYFEFNGKLLPYTFTLKNPGLNPLVIESVPFDKEGVTTIRIIQAGGATPERFRVTKSGNNYTWAKVQ